MYSTSLFPEYADPAPPLRMIGRKDLDQYFFPAWAAQCLVESQFPDLGPQDYIVDVGTGRGAFLQAVPNYVPCIGVELDPELAAIARRDTGRPVICGDFRQIVLPRQPTALLGNPPYSHPVLDELLDHAWDLLPHNGRCGFVLPASTFSYGGRFAHWHRRWAMRQDLLPRQVFPWASFPVVFCMFSKTLSKTLSGFLLFDEADALGGAPKRVRMVLIHGRPHKSVWRAVVEDAIQAYNGTATREQIRAYVEPRRPTANRFWIDKIRQTINSAGFVEDEDGVRLAA